VTALSSSELIQSIRTEPYVSKKMSWNFLALSCLLAVMITSQQSSAQSSTLRKASPPTPATVAGYDKAHCVSVPTNIRVCKGLSDSGDALLLEKNGTRIGTWPGVASLGETSDFEVLQGDLDNDGKPELIVSNHDSTSNGMGVNIYTISIFDAEALINFVPPLTFSVEEYGSSGTFVTHGSHVNILSTRWQWASDPRGRRGTGLYLMGQWWRYVKGELVLTTDRMILARRFLQSFADERDETQYESTIPFKWLTGARAETLRIDPLLLEKRKSVTEGVITDVSSSSKNDHRVVTIEFKSDNASSVSFSYPHDFGDNVKGLTYVGDAKENRIFPSRYLPSSPERWLKGRRATVVTYKGGDEKILWLK